MGGEQDPGVVADQFPDDRRHLGPAERVQPGGRLVKEQHLQLSSRNKLSRWQRVRNLA
jgi:hypothetical protein